jgi:hypothetical protein
MMFEQWADRHRLVKHGHDAAYAGAMCGVRIAVETCVRDTGLYDVVVTLDLECRVEPIILKRTKKTASENRVVRTAHALLGEQDTMRSVLIDDAQIVVRWWREVALEEIEEAVQRIAEAWRTLAPYR